jgi:predicted transcriptional regulator
VRDPLQGRSDVESVLGPLEVRVLDACWAAGRAVTVRTLTASFPGVAYTTLMTTADRLFRKGLLTREKAGRAFLYRARWSRRELDLHLAGSTLATLLPGDRGALRPIISMFVDEVSRRDASMLDELEAMIRRKRGDR